MSDSEIEIPRISDMNPALRGWTVVSWGADRFDSLEYSIHKAGSNGTNTILSLLLCEEDGSSTYFNVTQCNYTDGEGFLQRTVRDGTTDREPTTDMVIRLLSAAISAEPDQAHFEIIPRRQLTDRKGATSVLSWTSGSPHGLLESDLEAVRQDYIRRYVNDTEKPWIVNRPLVEIALARCARIGNTRISELSEDFARQVAYLTEERKRVETQEITRANQRSLARVVVVTLLVAAFNGFLSFQAFAGLFSFAVDPVIWVISLIFAVLLSTAATVSGYLFGLQSKRSRLLALPLALACLLLPVLGYAKTLSGASAFFSSDSGYGGYSVFVGLSLTGFLILATLGYISGSVRNAVPYGASMISTFAVRLDQLKSTTLADAKRVTAEVEHERLELLLQFAFMSGGHVDIDPEVAAWRPADDLFERISQVTI